MNVIRVKYGASNTNILGFIGINHTKRDNAYLPHNNALNTVHAINVHMDSPRYTCVQFLSF